MVRVVDPGPDKSVVKEVVCKNCGAKLEYVPRDIQQRKYMDYGGETDTVYWIDCPCCAHHITVKRY